MDDITYIPKFLHHADANYYYNVCLNDTNWQIPVNTEGKTSKVKRKMAYKSVSGINYNYANMTLKGEPWPLYMDDLSEHIEHRLDLENYGINSVLLNLYEDGRSEIRWHSDKEEQLGLNPIIPTLVVGSTRKFWFMNKETGEKTFYSMSHGDLLVMGPNCQQNYLHAILKESEVKEPRISLTFRKVIQ